MCISHSLEKPAPAGSRLPVAASLAHWIGQGMVGLRVPTICTGLTSTLKLLPHTASGLRVVQAPVGAHITRPNKAA